MSYSTNPGLAKARGNAMRELIYEGRDTNVVARRYGVNRTTIWRWKNKWLELNQHVQLVNYNRPNRTSLASPYDHVVVNARAITGKNLISSPSRLSHCQWNIPTLSSRPKTNPNALSQDTIDLVIYTRRKLKRCAEVVWYHATKLGIEDRNGNIQTTKVSLSSVRRILKRAGLASGRKKRIRPDNPDRPWVKEPGDLVETDTIHYICPRTGKRRYVYTVIDLHTRMTYSEMHDRIAPGKAAATVLKAQTELGFPFKMVQADNGPEYSKYFSDVLKRNNIPVRHTRLHRPNDNAHIERFNRTIQEECLGRRIYSDIPTDRINRKITNYIDYYNNDRIHLGLKLKTPIQMLQRS